MDGLLVLSPENIKEEIKQMGSQIIEKLDSFKETNQDKGKSGQSFINRFCYC